MKVLKMALFLFIASVMFLSSPLAFADGGDKDNPISMIVKQKTKFKGDLRLRFDTQRRNEGPGKDCIDRRRWRYRLRFGAYATPTDKTELGFRLASGSGFQTTTNQSYDGHGRGKDIFIDQVYASWKPVSGVKLTGGKFKNPFFTSGLVWDGDVNLEGGAFSYEDDFDKVGLFGNVVHFFVEEMDLQAESNKDPVMGGYQGGIKVKPAEDMSIQFGATYYNFRNLDLYDDGGIDDTADFIGYNHAHDQQMVFDADGQLINKFNCFEIGAKFKAEKVLPIPISVFGYYVKNMDADITELRTRGVVTEESDPADLSVYGGDDRDSGYQFGFDIGSKKKKSDFYFKYIYQVLEDYAFPAVFVDSDFNGGGTNNKGHMIKANYYLADNVILQGDFFVTKRASEVKDGKQDENRSRLDLIFKF
jgi:hypothetical protein